MALLDDFKLRAGISITTNDQYLIDYYLKPSIDVASKFSTNIKKTIVTLSAGILEYDLTILGVPAVVNGIQELIYDPLIPWVWEYKRDFYISSNRKTLVFPNGIRPFNGDFNFSYNELWSAPTLAPVETDMPSGLFPAVIRHSVASFKIDSIGGGNANMGSSITSGIQEKKEENMSIKYSSGGSGGSLSSIKEELRMAEKMMIDFGGNKYELFVGQIL